MSIENGKAKRSQQHANARPLEICPVSKVGEIIDHEYGFYRLIVHWIQRNGIKRVLYGRETQTTITKSHLDHCNMGLNSL